MPSLRWRAASPGRELRTRTRPACDAPQHFRDARNRPAGIAAYFATDLAESDRGDITSFVASMRFHSEAIPSWALPAPHGRLVLYRKMDETPPRIDGPPRFNLGRQW